MILKNLDFFCISETIFDENEVSEKNHHAPPYISKDKSCIVGIHWGIHNKNCVLKSDIDGIWERKSPTLIFDCPAYRMSWEDNLLHLCIHLPFYKIGMREILDIYNLIIFAQNEFSNNSFLKRIEIWNAYSQVYRALSLTLLMAPQIEEIMKVSEILKFCDKKVSTFIKSDTAKRSAVLSMLLKMRSTHINKIEKTFFIFKISKNYNEKLLAWLLMWKYFFYPPNMEVKKITGEMRSMSTIKYFQARLKLPFFIFYSLSRDHGFNNILIITITNFVEVFFSTISFSFVRNKEKFFNTKLKEVYKELE